MGTCPSYLCYGSFFVSLVVDVSQEFPIYFSDGCSTNSCDFGVFATGELSSFYSAILANLSVTNILRFKSQLLLGVGYTWVAVDGCVFLLNCVLHVASVLKCI